MALDSNGFIPMPPAVEFQVEFLPVIAAVSESLISLLGKRLHSLYLYGTDSSSQCITTPPAR